MSSSLLEFFAFVHLFCCIPVLCTHARTHTHTHTQACVLFNIGALYSQLAAKVVSLVRWEGGGGGSTPYFQNFSPSWSDPALRRGGGGRGMDVALFPILDT